MGSKALAFITLVSGAFVAGKTLLRLTFDIPALTIRYLIIGQTDTIRVCNCTLDKVDIDR